MIHLIRWPTSAMAKLIFSMTKFFFILDKINFYPWQNSFSSITKFLFIHDKILFYPWQNYFFPWQNSFLSMKEFFFIHDKTFFVHDKTFFLWQNSFSRGKIAFQSLTKLFLSMTKLFLHDKILSHNKTFLSCDKWRDCVVESAALWVRFATNYTGNLSSHPIFFSAASKAAAWARKVRQCERCSKT